MKKYDIFLFDADDTLFDYDKAEAAALETMFGRYNFAYTESLRQQYREYNSAVWRGYEKGEVTKDELQTLRFECLFRSMDIDCDAKRFNDEYLAELGKGAFLTDGAQDICRRIHRRGKPIYIVTNGILATQRSRIQRSTIKDYISDFFVSEYVGFQKPQSAYFDYVFAHIPPVDKSRMLITGDSLTADIAGGNNAGIDTCWFNSARAGNDTGIVPTYEIHHLSEISVFID